MKWLDLSLPSPEENLACDEALLQCCEETGGDEILRFWESPSPFVVLGYSNPVATNVHEEACRRMGVPILRRASGGGTVLQGIGCLNYSLILNSESRATLATITETNRFVLSQLKEALNPLLDGKVEIRGCSDLTLNNLKFSGNAQRRKKCFLLFHGTFLLKGFNVSLVEKYLPLPPRKPLYRQERPHGAFLTTLAIPGITIKEALRKKWLAHVSLEAMPTSRIRELLEERYSRREWHFKF